MGRFQISDWDRAVALTPVPALHIEFDVLCDRPTTGNKTMTETVISSVAFKVLLSLLFGESEKLAA